MLRIVGVSTCRKCLTFERKRVQLDCSGINSRRKNVHLRKHLHTAKSPMNGCAKSPSRFSCRYVTWKVDLFWLSVWHGELMLQKSYLVWASLKVENRELYGLHTFDGGNCRRLSP